MGDRFYEQQTKREQRRRRKTALRKENHIAMVSNVDKLYVKTGKKGLKGCDR